MQYAEARFAEAMQLRDQIRQRVQQVGGGKSGWPSGARPMAP